MMGGALFAIFFSFKPKHPHFLLHLRPYLYHHRPLLSSFSSFSFSNSISNSNCPKFLSSLLHRFLSPAPAPAPPLPFHPYPPSFSPSLLQRSFFASSHLSSSSNNRDSSDPEFDNNHDRLASQFVPVAASSSSDIAHQGQDITTDDAAHPSTSIPRRQLDTNDVDACYTSQKARFKLAFQKRVLDWEDVPGSLDSFPYYLSDITRDLLVDCTAAHLWQPKYASYGSGLPASSRRICLRGPAGSELYQERLVEALAKRLKASLLVLDSTVLSPHDYGDQEFSSESDGDDSGSEGEHAEGWAATHGSTQDIQEEQESEVENVRDGDFKVDALLEFAADSVEDYKKKLLLQEKKERRDAGHEDDDQEFSFRLRKGDRVKYVGSSSRLGKCGEARQVLRAGQRGRIVSVPKGHTGKVGVKFESHDRRCEDSMRTNRKLEELHRAGSLVDWCDLSDLEPDDSPQPEEIDEWLASAEALCEMAPSTRPLVVFFRDPKQWFERAVPSAQRKEFLERVEAKLDQLEGPIVLIASRTNEEELDFDDKKRLKVHLEGLRSRLNMKSPAAKWTVEQVLCPDDIYELFVNTIKIYAPQAEQQLREWRKQLHYDKELCNAKRNVEQLHKVLELHNMECSELSSVDAFGLNLTDSKAEKVVGWARNHHLGLCLFDPLLNKGKLIIPRTSMERAIIRLREQETKKAVHIVKEYKTAAEDEYENALLSAVIPPDEVGVKFDDIGALENVKTALRELVMLPLQRPELFVKGNLTRPCKGVLLFGPPGTGKTLLAKAVATEAGANFINITGSTITSKWFGDAEKLTKALFSLARKLTPAVIFVDEVDSLLGARGGSSEHEATRKTRNEFMAAWDGLKSKDNERVLVLAATNRPYDLDDAVIRRLPRRILVDLPNFENRVKILRVILAEENLLEDFSFEEVARMTHGYSGSDLKNLSIVAAYRPIRELLEAERDQEIKLGSSGSGSRFYSARAEPPIRGLRLDDFRESMAQVGASVAVDATSMNELRRWNERYGEGGNRQKSNFGFVF